MAVVAGNWKMHMGPGETRAFFAELDVAAGASSPELVIFPPSISLAGWSENYSSEPKSTKSSSIG